jgi:hypothetical protein
MAREVVKINFIGDFFVHEVRELAGHAVRLLLCPDAVGVFHPPGYRSSLKEFGDVLRRISRSTVTTSLDSSLMLPGDLDSSRFEKLIGKAAVANIESIVAESAW